MSIDFCTVLTNDLLLRLRPHCVEGPGPRFEPGTGGQKAETYFCTIVREEEGFIEP